FRAAGAHNIIVTYPGDVNWLGANGSFVENVNRAQAGASLGTSANPSMAGQPVTFTVTVTPTDAGATDTPTGQVDFYADGVYLGSGTLSNGVASLSISSLSVGNHTITAVYEGDSLYDGSSSDPLTQQVADNGNA